MPSVVLHLFGIRGVKQSSNRCVYTKYAECVTIHREENKAVKGMQMSMDGRGQGGLPGGGGMHPGPAGHGTSTERGENVYHQFLCDS